MTTASGSPISRFVLLGLENRSFDHMLGFLPREGHLRNLDGLTGREWNLLDPSKSGSGRYEVSGDAVYTMYKDLPGIGPPHTFQAANQQLTGSTRGPSRGTPVRNNGYVAAWNAELEYQLKQAGETCSPTPAQLAQIMACFTPDRLPALSTLAQEFVLFDRWFSSVPGPTMPNRLYWHAATSQGFVRNAWERSWDFRTIYNLLSDAGHSWRIYFGNDDVARNFSQLPGRDSLHLCPLDQFFTDAAAGTLPTYSYVIPRFISWTGPDQGMLEANSQHAPSDVAAGERLIASMYRALRANPEMWTSTAWLITYDEHGGFYDHVAPPDDVPNPDGRNSSAPDFDFTRLGVRVPAVLVSPWVPRALDHRTYEHASVAATLERHFSIGPPLTLRDEAANSFDGWLSGDAELRTDVPDDLDTPDHHGSTMHLALDDVQQGILRGAIANLQDPERTSLLDELDAAMTQQRAGEILASIVARDLGAPGL